jgi:hypothetical protein
MSKPITLTIVAFSAVLGGCADTPRADADYGKSVQQMVEAQTYDLNAARNPPPLAPASGDGVRLKNALDENRKDVAKGAEDVQKAIVFEVGEGN